MPPSKLVDAAIVCVAYALWTRRVDLRAFAFELYARICARIDRAMQQSAQQRVFNVLAQFKAPHVVFAAVDLCIFDLLSLRGPTSLTDLIDDMGPDEQGEMISVDAIGALMDALISLGLVHRSRADCLPLAPPGQQGGRSVYTNSAAAAKLLCRSSAQNILSEVLCLREECSRWSELSEALRTAPSRRPPPNMSADAACEIAPSPLNWVMDAWLARTHARTGRLSARPRTLYDVS